MQRFYGNYFGSQAARAGLPAGKWLGKVTWIGGHIKCKSWMTGLELWLNHKGQPDECLSHCVKWIAFGATMDPPAHTACGKEHKHAWEEELAGRGP